MLDEALGGGAPRPRATVKPASGDQGLLTAMAARLSKLERSQRTMRDEIVSKEKEILRLRSKCDALEKAAGDGKDAVRAQAHPLLEAAPPLVDVPAGATTPRAPCAIVALYRTHLHVMCTRV